MFKSCSFGFVFICVFVSAYCDTNGNARNDEVTVTVNTVNGQVRGHREYTLFDHKLFYSFKGIPYAQPPVGSLRFKVGFEIFCLFYFFESRCHNKLSSNFQLYL